MTASQVFSHEELTGENADLIEVLNLDEEGKSTREEVGGVAP